MCVAGGGCIGGYVGLAGEGAGWLMWGMGVLSRGGLHHYSSAIDMH